MTDDKPDAETLLNRKAGDALMRQAAMRGDSICEACFKLMHAASLDDAGAFVQTMVDYADDDWDDIRPY